MTVICTQEESNPFEGFPLLRESYFKRDDSPYIKTTEVGKKHIFEVLSKIQEQTRGILFGFAFEFNYHLLANRNIELALICDINSKMHEVYKCVRAIMHIVSNREAFLKKFEEELQNCAESFTLASEEREEILRSLQNKKYSWLATEEKFQRIRELYLQGRITHLNLDLGQKDPSFYYSLQKWVQAKGYIFDVIYVSNIPEWLWGARALEHMKQNLSHLFSDATIFIDAKKEMWESGKPKLRITTEVLKKGFPSFTPPPKSKNRISRSGSHSGVRKTLFA